MGNEMASGEPSYGMAIMKRSGKMRTQIDVMAEEIDSLRERCEAWEKQASGLSLLRDHLEEELGKMRNRCEKLNAMCIEMATDYARAEDERDEARERCEELERECDAELSLRKLASSCCHRATMERDEARQWARTLYKENANLEATLALCRSAGHEVSDIGFDALAENKTLRAQLAEARNKALDEAIALARRYGLAMPLPDGTVANMISDQVLVSLKDAS